MFRGTKFCTTYSVHFNHNKFSWVLDNICVKNMSIINNTAEQKINVIQQSNKRQLQDESNKVATKIQKVNATENGTSRVKRRNTVIMLGYSGTNYHGMQINRGMETIEESLLTALLKANCITQSQFDDIREIRFQRAARTDKGVSAVRQIVSLKLPPDVNKEEVNKHLPKDIRIFGIKRVTKGFNSKNQCDARTYRYVLPTFALASEDPSFLQVSFDDSVEEETRHKQVSVINGEPYKMFRLSTEKLNELNEILKLFEGTHNFHNFTSKTKALDPRARRYIIYFRCVETFVANNMEFAVLEIKGQSFMLHQIRKMVAIVIGISRNMLTKDFVNETFSLENYCVPLAPALGLSLHFVHYTYYDKRYGTDGIHETLDWNECNEEIEEFYKEHILKNIVDTEVTTEEMLHWLTMFRSPKRFSFKEIPAECEYFL